MAHAGTAHKYSERRIAFEHASPHTTSSDAPNTLLWIGGLTDGLLTVPYPANIAAALPPSWRIAEVLISSSYKGWATGSLARDAREIGECAAYFKKIRPGKKVVLMGHSTGCQDIMEYVVGPKHSERVPVDGAILQGGVSDRQAWEGELASEEGKKILEDLIRDSKSMIDAGHGKEVMPRKGNVVAEGLGGPMSAYRTYSLLAKGGDDDYFSSDLDDDVFKGTFGKFPATTPLCFLMGELDPYIPGNVNIAELLARWTKICREGGGVVDDVDGGVVPGAHHNLDGDPEEVVQGLVKRVCGFLDGVEKGSTWANGSRL